MTTNADTTTPAAAGYAMPAEWAPHEATWLGWPHNREDWPGKFAPIRWAYGEIVRHVAAGERVRIFVQNPRIEAQARGVLTKAHVDLGQIDFFRIPTDRGWTRDSGPMFVTRGGDRPASAVIDFGFTGWSKYPNHKLDDQAAALAAEAIGRPTFTATAGGERFVLEGGAIDVNGRGDLLTTEECLLDRRTQVRNGHLDRAAVEQGLRDWLGVRNVIWLGKGITGDDTHGHVDDLCRFVNATTAVLAVEDNPDDENYRPLAENRERLQGAKLADGAALQVVELPMPQPLWFDGLRLPASYANFYIANAAVLVPTFNDPTDRVALGILGELFTDRPVIGIHAVDLVWGFGTLHCLTQQQPAV